MDKITAQDIRDTVNEMDIDSVLEWLEKFEIDQPPCYSQPLYARNVLITHMTKHPRAAKAVIYD